MIIRAENPLESVQRIAAKLIASSPAGEGLRLVGGSRYRLLDRSCRSSLDLDYHWDGDLEEKRDEILALLKKRLLPEVKRRLGYEGNAAPLVDPAGNSPLVETISVAMFRAGVPGSRAELSINVTRIACLDLPSVRTVEGTVYLTASDADMVESKLIALLQHVFVQDRDLLDLFLFQSALLPNAKARLKRKLSSLSITGKDVGERLNRLRQNAAVHARGLEAILRQQVDAPAAANLRRAGGGKMVCETALRLLKRTVGRAKR